jgi:ATP-dependent helicase Lhr and Lhr-like helicase
VRTRTLRWWTWTGHRTDVTLAATFDGIADPLQRGNDLSPRLRSDLAPQRRTLRAANRRCLPEVAPRSDGLKFSAALPQRLAETTLADLDHAAQVPAELACFVAVRT